MVLGRLINKVGWGGGGALQPDEKKSFITSYVTVLIKILFSVGGGGLVSGGLISGGSGL